MPFREFFRGLMGIPPRIPDENNNRDVWSNDPFYDLFRDFSAMVEAQRVSPSGQADDEERPDSRQHSGFCDELIRRMVRISPESRSEMVAGGFLPSERTSRPTDSVRPTVPNSGQDDFSFQIFPEPQDMFRHFEEQFMRTFQGFGMMEFPSRFGHPPLEAPLSPPTAPPGGDSASLRDRMLKPGTSDPSETPRADTDLDDRVQEGGLSALLDPPAAAPAPLPPSAGQPHLFGSGSSSSSISVRRFIGPDGRVEEHRTETGPDGQTRQTVTRRLGDQEQTVVTRRLPDGTSQQQEHLTNMDEGGLPAFDRLWQEPSSSADSAPQDPSRLGESFWRNVFGW